MMDINLEFKKSIINHAYKNNKLTKEQFERALQLIQSEEEKLRYKKKLKSYENKELIKKYSEYHLT